MSIVSHLPGGGGIDINGVINQYTVATGNNISAGDFVQFINGMIYTETQLSSSTQSYASMSALLLPDNRIFIAHPARSSSWSFVLTGTLCSVSNGVITVISSTNLYDQPYTGRRVSAQLLPSGYIFIAHSNDEDSMILQATICSISGNSIVYNNRSTLSSTRSAGELIKTSLLPDGQVFVMHSKTNTNYCFGMICTINGTTVTYGTDVQLSYGSNFGNIETLSNGSVLITNNTYAYICTINGTTITKGSNVDLPSSNGITFSGSYGLIPKQLSSGEIVILGCSNSDNNYAACAVLCSVNGTSITWSTPILLTDGNVGTSYLIRDVIILNNTTIFAVYSSNFSETSNLNYLFGIRCTVKNGIISSNTRVQLTTSSYSSNDASILLLANGNIFITFQQNNSAGTSGNLSGVIFDPTQYVESYSSRIEGIAKTSGSAGETIDVYVPQ